ETITAASTTITAAKAQVPAATLTAAPSRVIAARRKRTNGVVIRDPEEFTTTTSTIIHTESKSKDKGKGILVEKPKPLKKQAQIKQDEKYARELEAELNRTIDWDENQRSVYGPAKVKGWKLLELCGVQIITFTTTQLILLVERKYPLIRFTLDQMLNAVRLEVEEESEVSLELLRFIRQQHQEGAQLE
nr:hypothetical protein [Tanacetum cinerariifolium]